MSSFLTWTLPMPVVASPGSSVSLSSILNADFGASNPWSNYWLAYYGAAQLQSWDFNYWNLAGPAVAVWDVNGIDIGAGFNNQRLVSPGSIGSASIMAGNDIGAFAYLTVPVAAGGSEYIQYSVMVVDPNVMSPVAGHGEPTPQDIVNSAYRFANYYGVLPNDNDCHNIAEEVAAATGATLPYSSGSLDPTQNVDGGFWRVVYRGSDPNPVSNWHTLVQPGDVVRMGWDAASGGGQHTTTILSVNSDGSMVVYDNSSDQISIKTVKFDLHTIPTTITIYRLASDGLYLEKGSDLGETLQGTLFNDHILGAGGDDKITGGLGNDVIDGGTGFNTACYSGTLASYVISQSGGGIQVVDLRSGSPDGSDQLTNIQCLSFSDRLETAPTATAANKTATHGQILSASSLFSVSDSEADPISKYALWDSTGSGHWLVNGVLQGTNVEIDITASQLAQTTYQSGSGADQLWIRPFDGILWGAWDAFTVTAPIDNPPVVAASDVTATHNQNVAASSLFSVSDADGDTITSYQFWDSTPDASSGHFVMGGVAQGSGVAIDVSAAQLASTTFQSGSGSDDLWVRANDGFVWGAWKEFHVNAPVDQAPVASAGNVTGSRSQTSIAASSLFNASDADGDAITKYGLWDSNGNGHFVVNGVAQGSHVEIDITAAQLAQTSYQFGTTSDQLWVRAYDGLLWGSWVAFNAAPFVNHLPVASASDVTATHNQNVAASSLFSVSDADGDTITSYQFWDSTADASSGHFVVGGVAQGSGVAIDVSSAQLVGTTFQSGSGSDDLWVRANDGFAWGSWKEFHVNAPVDNAPVVNASDVSATHGQNIAASSLFTVSDADHDTITGYQFWDSTADPASGHFVVAGAAQPSGQSIDVSAAQLANTSFQSGSGSDDLWVRAFDGSLWSSWKEFHVNAPVDNAPVVTASDVSAAHGQNVAASSLFTVSDADQDTITKYQFWDSTADPVSGHFVVAGAAQGSNQSIDVSAAQLANTTFQSGSGSDDLWVRSFDGMSWSNWKEFHVNAPTDNPPVVSATDFTATHNQNIAASTLFSASDGDGDAIANYQLWDSSSDPNSGHWVVGGTVQAANVAIGVTAAQLSTTTFQSGSGADDLWARAYDGFAWGPWKEFHVNAPLDTAPVVTAPEYHATPGQSVAASSLFSVSDPDGDTITQYQFWDSTPSVSSGHWSVAGIAQPANSAISVSAAQLAATSFQSGTVPDDLWVRASDGMSWSAWQEFHVLV